MATWLLLFLFPVSSLSYFFPGHGCGGPLAAYKESPTVPDDPAERHCLKITDEDEARKYVASLPGNLMKLIIMQFWLLVDVQHKPNMSMTTHDVVNVLRVHLHGHCCLTLKCQTTMSV